MWSPTTSSGRSNLPSVLLYLVLFWENRESVHQGSNNTEGSESGDVLVGLQVQTRRYRSDPK